MPTLRRLGALVRLTLILGTPLAVVAGLFGWGLAFGAIHRDRVLHWEERLFGWAPPEPSEAGDEPRGSPESKAEEPAADRPPPGSAAGGPRAEAEPEPEPAAAEPPPTESEPPAATPEPTPPPAEPPTPPASDAQPEEPAAAEPAAAPRADLEAKLALPVTIRVAVLVDETVRGNHPDWIDYAQRLIASASSVYAEHFGIRLDPVAVALWPVPTAGTAARALLDDLRRRRPEGADVVIGLTDRPLSDGHLAGLGTAPFEGSPFNGTAALVYARPRLDPRLPHLPVLLHELGHLLGARDVTDRTSDAYRSGSWMAPLDAPRPARPWIDPDNRRRILLRKDRPFAPAGSRGGQDAHTP